MSGDSPWVRRFLVDGEPRARLVCFPHAGGGASAFRTWELLLPDGVELVVVQLPARETRIADPAPADLPTLLDELAAALDFGDGIASTLFGHSWGAVLAFELCRRLRWGGRPAVAHLIVSGARAPHLLSPPPPISHLPRDELLAELAHLNGIHPELLASDDYLDLVIPALRADLRLVERYRLAAGEPLPCPITAFGGTADPLTPVASLDGWREYTAAEYRRLLFAGDHFFFVNERGPVVAAIGAILTGRNRSSSGSAVSGSPVLRSAP